MKKIITTFMFFDVTMNLKIDKQLEPFLEGMFIKKMKEHKRFKSVEFNKENITIVFRSIHDYTSIDIRKIREFLISTYRSITKEPKEKNTPPYSGVRFVSGENFMGMVNLE